MSHSPIALFVYNRPLHTAKTIAALTNNSLANKSELFVFSDGAKNDSDIKDVEKVRGMFKGLGGFKNLTIVERASNVGLAQNIIEGISEIFRLYETVICLEDDLITSQGFLEYMNDALRFYQNKNIFSISGYLPPIDIPSGHEYSTFTAMRNSSWGWATWQSKWQNVDWDVSDFNKLLSDRKKKKLFEQAGNDTTMMLLKQQLGKINSWSIRFNYAAFKMGEPTIYPTKSLIMNIGVDGSGTNMRWSEKYQTEIVEEISSSNFAPAEHNNQLINKHFKEFFDTSFIRRVINLIKIIYYKPRFKKAHKK